MARNLGGQVKAYEDDFERIPFDLQLGISKKLRGAPLRLSATMTRLNDWHGSFINHFVVGADILVTSRIYIAGGYNFRRADEMTIPEADDESSHGRGCRSVPVFISTASNCSWPTPNITFRPPR